MSYADKASQVTSGAASKENLFFLNLAWLFDEYVRKRV
jgi:hypothetical protein